ncbi:MAG: aminotransferase class V-fold PLP-dependent enzyme [Phycisphaerae bacterium]
MTPIYLDHNATTPVAPAVLDAMLPCLRERFGNPSSLHVAGQQARHTLERAREQVAALVRAAPRDIVFTSGGTEADNLAILGTLAATPARRHIVTTTVEHAAVRSCCQRLEKDGYPVSWTPVDRLGRLDLDAFAAALRPDTALASVMWANNETGVIFPIAELAEICAARRVPLHVDAVQAVGKLPIDLHAVPVTLLSLSAHKFHGPKGAGALVVRKGARLRSQAVGGHQERDIRPGTENIAGIVGLGAAAELAQMLTPTDDARIASLRDRLEQGILSRFPTARVNGDAARRVANTTNVSFEALNSEAILIALSEAGICASAGSACSSGAIEPSHVLVAMGVEERYARGMVRFSVSRFTTADEIDTALDVLPGIVERLMQLAPAGGAGD